MPDNNQPRDVFISYSRKNKAEVLLVKDEIERMLGLTCWMDLSDIPCGTENFKKKVIPGIKQTRLAFLFFLSAESQASENAMKEIEFARKRAKKRVILVRFNDDEMTDEFAFDYQNADIIDWRVPEQKGKLLHDLSEWADNEGASDAMKPQDGTKGNDMRGARQQAYGIPMREIDRAVTDQFAHFLYAKKGWKKFAVMNYEAQNDYLKCFMVRDGQDAPVRLIWLQCSDIYSLVDLEEGEFDSQAEAIFSDPQIPPNKTVDDAWNYIAESFMPALLFAYNVCGLIYESDKRQILIPLCDANPLLCKGRAGVCVREFRNRDCACVVFDESKLSLLIGKSRSECSELVIGWIKESGLV